MTTRLEVTKEDIAERERQKGVQPGNIERIERENRKEIAREKLRAAVHELPGSRYKEILLFMLDEGIV